MSIFEAIILGLVQGLTEFIPVSSSGHLVLMRDAFGLNVQGLVFDVALHFGTLMALAVYFWKDIGLLVQGLLGKGIYRRVAWWIGAATIPAVIFGVLLESAAESAFRTAPRVAINLIAVAFLMLAAERWSKRYTTKTSLEDISAKQAIGVGLAQAAAIVPGVSRSGSTITAGLFLGLDRVTATRFSFLLGLPIMVGAVAKVLLSDQAAHQITHEPMLFVVGIVVAFISGLVAIRFLLRYLAHHTLAVFAYYRIALGIVVLLISAT
jgi:undecaprenyl-diphosphatase